MNEIEAAFIVGCAFVLFNMLAYALEPFFIDVIKSLKSKK